MVPYGYNFLQPESLHHAGGVRDDRGIQLVGVHETQHQQIHDVHDGSVGGVCETACRTGSSRSRGNLGAYSACYHEYSTATCEHVLSPERVEGVDYDEEPSGDEDVAVGEEAVTPTTLEFVCAFVVAILLIIIGCIILRYGW